MHFHRMTTVGEFRLCKQVVSCIAREVTEKLMMTLTCRHRAGVMSATHLQTGDHPIQRQFFNGFFQDMPTTVMRRRRWRISHAAAAASPCNMWLADRPADTFPPPRWTTWPPPLADFHRLGAFPLVSTCLLSPPPRTGTCSASGTIPSPVLQSVPDSDRGYSNVTVSRVMLRCKRCPPTTK